MRITNTNSSALIVLTLVPVESLGFSTVLYGIFLSCLYDVLGKTPYRELRKLS